MTKFTVLVGVVFCAVFAAGVAGYNGRSKNWEQFHGQQVGFGSGKCSALSGILPDPQSGCCGKHAGETDTGDGENNGGGSNDGNEIGGGDQGDEENNGGGSNDDNEIGGGDQDDESNDNGDGDFDDGNNDIGGGGGNGNGNGFDFGDGLDLGDIFGGLGMGNGGNPWFDGFNSKKVVENASDTSPDKFITAGTPAGIREFPWLVHLLIKVQEGHLIGCGGSLISPRFVLTAAHCVKVNYRSYNDISIVLAEYDTRKSPRDCVGRTCVDNVVMHPDRVIAHRGFELNQLANDVALMRLRGSAPYTDFIRPICLPPFNIDSPNNQGTPLTISGWGQVGTNRPASPIKLKAQVKLVPHQVCSQHYPGLTKGHVCAASRNGQDTCQGDSGGPLMVQQGNNYYVVGIVSGKSAQTTCGTSFPTLYTNVFAYSKWIKQHMGN